MRTPAAHLTLGRVSHLVRVQQAVVDPELHQLGQQVQDLPLQRHRGAGGVLLQGLDHQRLKQPDVVVDDILNMEKLHKIYNICLLVATD